MLSCKRSFTRPLERDRVLIAPKGQPNLLCQGFYHRKRGCQHISLSIDRKVAGYLPGLQTRSRSEGFPYLPTKSASCMYLGIPGFVLRAFGTSTAKDCRSISLTDRTNINADMTFRVDSGDRRGRLQCLSNPSSNFQKIFTIRRFSAPRQFIPDVLFVPARGPVSRRGCWTLELVNPTAQVEAFGFRTEKAIQANSIVRRIGVSDHTEFPRACIGRSETSRVSQSHSHCDALPSAVESLDGTGTRISGGQSWCCTVLCSALICSHGVSVGNKK